MAIIKRAEFTTCGSCNARHRVSDEVFGCDYCGQELAVEPLQFVIFSAGANSTETKDVHCCSWRCVFKELRRVQVNYFVSLPYLVFDKDVDGQTPADFWAAMQEVSE